MTENLIVLLWGVSSMFVMSGVRDSGAGNQ